MKENVMDQRNLVGSRIRQARLAEKPKVTLADLSARLEVLGVSLSVSSIAKIERGERIVTDVQLVALAEALKVSMLWLLGLEDR